MSRTPRNLRAPEDPLGTPGGPTLPPSDDEDSDGRSHSAMSYKERRREAHTQAEQKRRDSIKKGYEYLQDLVPSINEDTSPSASNAKASKAVVLQKAIGEIFYFIYYNIKLLKEVKFTSLLQGNWEFDMNFAQFCTFRFLTALLLFVISEYIQLCEVQKRQQEEEVMSLRRELASLQIIRDTYDELVKVHQRSTGTGVEGEDGIFIPSEVKFRVFQVLMDSLFMSFNEKVGMSNFQELSRCVISWIEEFCTPYALQDLMLQILEQTKKESQERLTAISNSAK